jgi:hypothetical protein
VTIQDVKCQCGQPHYPLNFFRRLIEGRGLFYLATRGDRPVAKVLVDGWERADVDPRIARQLAEAYDRSHRFDWLHTPTYLDDKETHLRMKEQTRGVI